MIDEQNSAVVLVLKQSLEIGWTEFRRFVNREIFLISIVEVEGIE